jgi:hypothetical protein
MAVYMSIHESGEGVLGIEICLTEGQNVRQSVLLKDFTFRGKSVVKMSEVDYSEFDSHELTGGELADVMNNCSPEWSEYEI